MMDRPGCVLRTADRKGGGPALPGSARRYSIDGTFRVITIKPLKKTLRVRVRVRILPPSCEPPVVTASSADLRFRSAAFHPESSLSFSNPRAPINGQECAIVTKPNRSYRNGRRRRHTAIIYAPAPRGTRPKSRGPCEAGPRYLLIKDAPAWSHGIVRGLKGNKSVERPPPGEFDGMGGLSPGVQPNFGKGRLTRPSADGRPLPSERLWSSARGRAKD